MSLKYHRSPGGKSLSRAQRRHERDRLKDVRQVYWGHRGPGLRYLGALNERQLGMVVTTAAVCSCLCCGSPRNHPGRTKDRLSIQERSWLQEPTQVADDE